MVRELHKLMHMIDVDRTPSMDGSTRLDAKEANRILRSAIDEFKRMEAGRVALLTSRDASINVYCEQESQITALRAEVERLRDEKAELLTMVTHHEAICGICGCYSHTHADWCEYGKRAKQLEAGDE